MSDPEDEQEGGSVKNEAPEDWKMLAGEKPNWATESDMKILHMLKRTDLILTPSVIAENLDISRVTVTNRLSTLQGAGLVEKVDRGKYRISDKGVFLFTEDPEDLGDGWTKVDKSEE